MNGINVIGFISANFGLGIAARNTVRLLLQKGCPVSIVDLRLDDGRSLQDRSFDHLLCTGTAALPHAINLFHCNPPHFSALIKSGPRWLELQNCLNVCVPFWEQTVLPAFWLGPLKAMDVVLCPSRFIEQAVAAACPSPLPHVRHYPQTTFLPQRRPAQDRCRFGLPEQGVLFIQSFEMGSDCARKNPWAALDAFKAAFTSSDKAYLIVKLQNSTAGFENQLARLKEYAAGNDRIIIYNRNLGYDEVLSLYETCDCFVSLHRSEGLGLGPMEAMFLKKPVIATAWSGNMDFMDERNSCLVNYQMVPVESPVYQKLVNGMPVEWADPDPGQASGWMRSLYENPELRERIGANAQQAMRKRREECKKNGVFERLDEALFRKQYRARVKKAEGAEVASAVIKEQSAFFSTISGFLKMGEVDSAFDVYYRERDWYRESTEVLRIDEIMRKVRPF